MRSAPGCSAASTSAAKPSADPGPQGRVLRLAAARVCSSRGTETPVGTPRNHRCRHVVRQPSTSAAGRRRGRLGQGTVAVVVATVVLVVLGAVLVVVVLGALVVVGVATVVVGATVVVVVELVVVV